MDPSRLGYCMVHLSPRDLEKSACQNKTKNNFRFSGENDLALVETLTTLPVTLCLPGENHWASSL